MDAAALAAETPVRCKHVTGGKYESLDAFEASPTNQFI
jgi:hypothetical protein